MNKILIVDSDKSFRFQTAKLLTDSGYAITNAGNGIEALISIKKEKPDLILCGLDMPLMGGMELLASVKEQDYMINLPFIFIVDKQNNEVQKSVMNLGADGYLVKPVDKLNLLNRIQIRMEKKSKLDAKFEKLKKDISLYVPHELQTPIFPIIGYSEMILDNIDDLSKPELLNMVQSIHGSAIRLKARMIKFNKFAELRIQASEKYSNNADDFLNEYSIDDNLIDNFLSASSYINNRKNNLNVDLENSLLNIAENDIHNLLLELIENACKYSPNDTQITFKGVKCRSDYCFIIKNYGDNFDIRKYGEFEQNNRDENQQIGNGLGIAIIKQIAAKYKLKIYSEFSVQNSIHVEFPSN